MTLLSRWETSDPLKKGARQHLGTTAPAKEDEAGKN